MWAREKDDSTLLSCRVHPNSSREGIGEIRDDCLTIYLNAPAVEGKANSALIKFLSKGIGVAKSRVSIVKGGKSRNKLVAVEGKRPEEIARTLGISL
ncbi:MAG TPA: DUF167 domain-containing protein [Desulfomonilia bacterium]|nr:DUF167 domain-containing protein [Desulfomonilia bacterium]